MSAAALLNELEQAGFQLRVDEAGQLHVSPGSRLSPEQLAAVAAEKAAIVQLLNAPPPLRATFQPRTTDACPDGHTPLVYGGMACEVCECARCCGCGTWM